MTTKTVKLLNLYASPRGTFPAKSVVDLPIKEADQLIKEGYAVHAATQHPVSTPKRTGGRKENNPAPETATDTAPQETAAETKPEDNKA